MSALAPLEEAVSLLKELKTLDGIGRGADPVGAIAECVKAGRLADEAMRIACEIRAHAGRERRRMVTP